MKILQMNNYHYLKGGAERYYFSLSELLAKYGHEIAFFSVEDEQNFSTSYSKYFGRSMSFSKEQSIIIKIDTAFRILYSFENNRRIENLLREHSIKIAHAHNIYHRVCSSVFRVLSKHKIPIIVTLHDYKLCCPTYTLFRKGMICEDCINKGKFSVIKNNCTKDDRLMSWLHYTEAFLHQVIKSYDKVSFFICPSMFSLKKHLEAGIPEKKLVHIPNFTNVEDFEPSYKAGEYILYVGRLSHEKGIFTLLKAIKDINFKLKIVGDGPLREDCEAFVRENNLKNVEFLGYKSGDDLKELYQKSAFLVMPSEWYENAPLTILECFAYGKPLIGSRIGGIPEMILDGETGLLFNTGDVRELRGKINYLLRNPAIIDKMGRSARARVEQEYNAELHYERLMQVYSRSGG